MEFDELKMKKSMSKEFWCILVSSFAGFIPWMMTFPQAHYTIMAMPTVMALAAYSLDRFSRWFFPIWDSLHE